MSSPLIRLKPLPPEAQNDVKCLFVAWREKNFPDGVPFEDFSFVNVSIPEKELLEIDANHRVNDGMASAVGEFRIMRDEYVDELWQPEKDERERQQRLRQQKIGLVLAAVIIACIWIYFNQ